MSNNKQRTDCQQGFTLVEVMIALFIFLIIALGLARGEITALRAHSDNLFRDEALRLAEDALNNLRGQSFGAPALVDTGGNWTAPIAQTVKIRGGTVTLSQSTQITDINATATQFKRIDVAVGWNPANSNLILPAPGTLPVPPLYQAVLSTIIVRSE